MQTTTPDYKVLFEATPTPYLILHPDYPRFTIAAVNEAYLAATLTKRANILGKGLFDVFPENPDDIKSNGVGNVSASLMRVIYGHRPDAMPVQKYDIPNHEGGFEVRYWTPINTPILDAEGQISWIIHRVEDVTALMKQRRSLISQSHSPVIGRSNQSELFAHVFRVEEAQERYRRLTTLLPIGIFNADAEGQLTYVNEVWQRMTSCLWRDTIKRPWYVGVPGAQQINIAENWQAKKNAPFQAEYKTALDMWYLVQIVPEFEDDNEETVIDYMGYVLDITERKQAEEAQRTRAEALSELDRAKTIFFSNISHELRTPLTLILGPVEDCLSEQGTQRLPPRQQERLEIVQRSAQRLLKLVNSSLDFTRLEEGRLPASFEPIDLATKTRDLATMFGPTMEKAGLGFEIAVAPLSEPVFVDRDLYSKIVFNLLSNALKYTLSGKVVLALQEQQDRSVRLSVKDTGIGIPASELPCMFQRFHRIDNAEGRSHEGAGIGLSLTKELVKLHGGTIEVASELGKGSLFTVTIPMGVSHLPAQFIKESASNKVMQGVCAQPGQLFLSEALSWVQPLEPTLSAPVVECINREGFRILVADDHPDLRKLLRDLLSPTWEVKIVSDGEAALQAAKTEKFDLIISDIMMAKKDGFQLTQELRADEKTKALPIILVSARADEESRLMGLKSGADDYIVKPFSKQELVERVGGRLRAGRLRHQLTQEMHAFEDESQRQKRLLQLVSHELRNPMTGIRGNSDVVENCLETIANTLRERNHEDPMLVYVAEARAATRVIAQCTDYQKVIADDVLDLAKLQEQKMELHITEFEAQQIARDAISMLSARAHENGVHLLFDCAMRTRSVSGDATRLTQVLVNLLSNAIKFTPKGGSVTIGLRSPVETPEKITLEFMVADTGMGMSEEQQSKIFAPFVQASSSIHSKFGGSGLGLAISKSLVELMAGNITVESALGKGSRFTVTVVCGNVVVHASPQTPVAKQGRKQQILIADDSVINQKILKKLLETAGHRVVVANNGEEALNLWDQMDRIDTILMDIEMPVMTGIEATQRIRQAERLRPAEYPPVLIIGLSGNNSDAFSWREIGMNDYIMKPYSQRDLLEKIAQPSAPPVTVHT